MFKKRQGTLNQHCCWLFCCWRAHVLFSHFCLVSGSSFHCKLIRKQPTIYIHIYMIIITLWTFLSDLESSFIHDDFALLSIGKDWLYAHHVTHVPWHLLSSLWRADKSNRQVLFEMKTLILIFCAFLFLALSVEASGTARGGRGGGGRGGGGRGGRGGGGSRGGGGRVSPSPLFSMQPGWRRSKRVSYVEDDVAED